VQSTFPKNVSSGTGFFINRNGDVVTANHVIHPPGMIGEPTEIKILVRIPTIQSQQLTMLSSFTGHRAVVKATDLTHDIVVLGIVGTSPFTKPTVIVHTPQNDLVEKLDVSKLSEPLPKDGQSIFISGYPLSLPTLITTSGFIASSDPIAFEGELPHMQVSDVLWADIQANHGNSGGPVFSATNGDVVGMVVSVKVAPVEFTDGTQAPPLGVQWVDKDHSVLHPIGYNAGIAIIIPTKYITALLRSQNIPFNDLQSGHSDKDQRDKEQH